MLHAALCRSWCIQNNLLPILAQLSLYLLKVGLEEGRTGHSTTVGRIQFESCLGFFVCFGDPDFSWIFSYVKLILLLYQTDVPLKCAVHQAPGSDLLLDLEAVAVPVPREKVTKLGRFS